MNAFGVPTILVADDEAPARQAMCRHLAGQSYRCIGVDIGDAPDAARGGDVDVALVIVAPPSPQRGLTLARQLRSETRDLAIVLIAGAPGFDLAVEVMRLGVLDCLVSPSSTADLVDAVERAVEWRAAALDTRRQRSRWHAEIRARCEILARTLSTPTIRSSAALRAALTALGGGHDGPVQHGARVGEFSLRIALELGVREPMLGFIERAALLHDIGRLALPDAILAKPGPLAADELALVRGHVQIGHDLAAAVPFLQPSAAIIAAAHERWDGTGYPLGLTGDAIPLGARIVAVGDAFDALASPIRRGDTRSVAWANAQLVGASGTTFDPAVVAAWLRSVDGSASAIGEPGLGGRA